MAAYLYVLRAVEDELTKIGISRSLNKRLSAHTGNSSNPLVFQPWRLFQFATISDAHKIEQLARKRLTDSGFAYRSKKELFTCSPTEVTKVVEELCAQLRTGVLKNFPFDLEEALDTFGNFPCLPDHALDMMTPLQRKLYWKGIRDALFCLGYFEGIVITRADFLHFLDRKDDDAENTSEIWASIVDHYRNRGLLEGNDIASAAAKKTAWTSFEKIKAHRRFAFSDWQELDDELAVAS